MDRIIAFFDEFFRLLKTIQLTDVLDIVLVTFLIYQLIAKAHSSRTGRLLKAAVAFLVITWLTDLADLHVLNFLIDWITELGLIAVVVLFQPELRRAVDRLGSTSIREVLSPKAHNQEMDYVISQTVMACEAMSKERIGALIVFERTARLDDYFKTGTIIDGRVSEQLLRNIFFPKAALHDGAMVIRGTLVAAAGCVLPLSDNRRISADLGTRHRAGIGVSEVSDAVVVIVSEETGTISVAVGGMLKRHLAPQTLEKLLSNELCPQGERTDSRIKPLAWMKKKEGKHGNEEE